MIEPPVPSECNLTDFKFMPLEVARLRKSKSWLLAKRKPEIGFYMINLWSAAWHNVPAGSLEDDDDQLADQAMCDPKRWPKVREEALRGWVKATDGRLYHNIVTEKVLEAWGAKRDQRNRTEAARKAKVEKRHKGNGVATSVTTPVTRSVTEPVTEPVTEIVTRTVTDTVTGSKGEGERQRQGREQELKSSHQPQSTASARELLLDRLCRVLKIDLATLHRRPLFAAFPAIFHDWTTKGCDPDRDIWPTIERVARAGKLISGPSYFEPAIIDARDKRLASEPSPIERWTFRVKAYRDEGFWPRDDWGPAPDEPGCLAPADLIKAAA